MEYDDVALLIRPNLVRGAFRTLEDLKKTTSMNKKIEVLERDGDCPNPLLQYLLYLTYNPFITYGIKKIPVDGVPNSPCTDDGLKTHYEQLCLLLSGLSTREITGNAAIFKVGEFLKSLSPDEFKWYSHVIMRDLHVGITQTTINKVFKKLVPSYEVQLANRVDSTDLTNFQTNKKTLKQIPQLFYVQYKIDGFRCNLFVDYDGTVTMKSRSGKFLTGYTEMLQQAAYLPRGFVYDGEIVAPELFDFILNHKDSTSVTANRQLFAEAMSHCHSKETNKQGVLNIFDIIPISQWSSQNPVDDYTSRVHLLNEEVVPVISDLNSFRVVPTYGPFNKSKIKDLQQVENLFRGFLNTGWEGAMLKDTTRPYEFKRSKAVWKMKLMDTADLQVIDLFEGTGKYEGMLGGAIVDYKGNLLRVGSGWSDSQRKEFWENKNALIGKTIEVAYQAETYNKNGRVSVSFPVMKKIRRDK